MQLVFRFIFAFEANLNEVFNIRIAKLFENCLRLRTGDK